MNGRIDALEALTQTLRQTNEAALVDLDLSDFAGLERELPHLDVWRGGGTGLEDFDDATLADAIRAYRREGVFDGIAQARAACYGCVREVDGARLIEEPGRFKGLLDYVDQHRYYARSFRRCYRGLLHAWLTYDPEAAASEPGRRSWQDLWVFLERRKNMLETPGTDPEWVTALLEHRNILTRDPTSRYGMAALRGNFGMFDTVRDRLGIPNDSWIVRRLVLSILQAAMQLPDQHFKAAVVRLLVLFSKHPLMLDYGLARVIDRYAACAAREVHARLREFAVVNWGDPRVPTNLTKWSAVTAAGREMIAGWLNAGGGV